MINLTATAEAAVILLAFRRFLTLDLKKKNLILNLISAALLSFNIYRYISRSIEAGFTRIPVEFSSVAYFLVPLIVLLKIPLLRVWAAYSALLAGSGYFVSIVLLGDRVYSNYKTVSIVTALLCHGALLLIGLLLISEKRFSPYSGWIIAAGLIYITLRTMLLRARFSGGGGIFIYAVIYALRPVKIFGAGIQPVYYLSLICLLILSFNLFYRLNLKLAKNRGCKKSADRIKP